MQVSNVLDSLRNRENPNFQDPVQWLGPRHEWSDTKELYFRLKEKFQHENTKESAQHWAAFIDSERPMDWPAFMDFFSLCPKKYQTLMQRKVTSTQRSRNPEIAGMQLRYRMDRSDPTFESLLEVKGCLNHMEMEELTPVVQRVWEHGKNDILVKHLPARLVEFLNSYPSAIDVEDCQPTGSSMLLGLLLTGAEDNHAGSNPREDDAYYTQACRAASMDDLLKLEILLDSHPHWTDNMMHATGMVWYEPFLQEENPHHLMFNIYRSLDPEMDPKGLFHFLKKQLQLPAESYGLDSIFVS